MQKTTMMSACSVTWSRFLGLGHPWFGSAVDPKTHGAAAAELARLLLVRGRMRWWVALGIGLWASLSVTVAQAALTAVDSFSEIPNAVFHNIVHPTPFSTHYHDATPIVVGGKTVTVYYYSEAHLDHRYPIGILNLSSSSWNPWRVTTNQAVDPGDFIADYDAPEDGDGDLILNFSEPLTGFGTTSVLGPFANSLRPNNADRFMVYDGPNGTGNVLADVTTSDIIHLQLRLDFKGVVAPAPIIRSVRYINEWPGFSVDGFAIAVPEPATLILLALGAAFVRRPTEHS